VKTRIDDFLVSREQWAVQPPRNPLKDLVRSVTPTSALRLITATRRFAGEKIIQPHRVKMWKRELHAIQRFELVTPVTGVHFANLLPNSGGISLNIQKADPMSIIETGRINAEKRALGVVGFEGLALDDALSWLEEYKHYSFVPLANAVSKIARTHLGASTYTTLELGCGWGGFRVLLQAFGSRLYLGVDANPLPFCNSPFMLEAAGNYRLLNLQEKIDFGATFDVVCSFEVLEHIREDQVANILETISNHLSPTSLFIGTAAFTDYTDVHVTVRPRGWWLNRFREHGLVPVRPVEETPWLRMLASSHPFNWNASTSSIFVLQKLR
jgi:hypothetical protein